MGRKFRFSITNPTPRAECGDCGLIVSHSSLRERVDYRGGSVPVPTGLLVCRECYDAPQPYYARAEIKRDPQPVYDPRPEPADLLVPVWILSTGFWDDGLPWLDSQNWNDGPP